MRGNYSFHFRKLNPYKREKNYLRKMFDKVVSKSRDQSVRALADSKIKDSDVRSIWSAMSAHIKDEMSKKRGVVVPGFGTFTFLEQHLDIGNNKELLKIKPAFILSDKFLKWHNVEQREKEHINETLPVHRINYAAINERLNRKYTRDMVETVLNESFMAIDHYLRSDGHIQVPLDHLGKLSIGDIIPKPKKQAKFEFTSEIKIFD